MNREETKKTLMTMQALYPNFQPKDMTATIEAWAIVMEDYDYREVSIALKSYSQSNNTGYAPAPGQLVSIIQKMKSPEPMSETEAFGILYKAIQRSAWHSEEEFNNLPPMIQKVVGDAHQLQTWAISETDEVLNVVQPHFMRDYRNAVERQQEYEKLPEDVRKRIDEVNNRPHLYEGRLITKEEAVNE